MSLLREMYNQIPRVIQLPIDYVYGVIPRKLRLGKVYYNTKELLEKSQWWSYEEHINFQTIQMKKILRHAYENVPYYTKIFNSSGFNPYSFKYLDQIEVLPLLNKKIIQENFEELKAGNLKHKNVVLKTTGGTSGNQLRFYAEKNTYQKELAFVESIWERVGVSKNSRFAVLRNDIFKNEKPYRYDWKHRKLILDNFHLSDIRIKIMLDKLRDDRIEFIHTYPSAILTLCDYIRRTGYKLEYQPKAILVTSENVYPGQKELIENTFKCRLFTFFGHSERACIAGWCENTDLYHLNSEYGYTELLDENMNVIKELNKKGEIVCTGFNNLAMPFIRYQTEDYSSYANQGDCNCGRHYNRLNSVEGRWIQEMLLCKDGSKISITALNMHSDIFENVKYYQMYQDTIGICVIYIVKTELYNKDDEVNILREFNNKICGVINFKVKYVDSIEKTSRGKYKYIIQKLKF